MASKMQAIWVLSNWYLIEDLGKIGCDEFIEKWYNVVLYGRV